MNGPPDEGNSSTSSSFLTPSKLALVFGLSLLVGSVTHFALERATSRGRVLPGTTALGVPLGGLSAQSLEKAVRDVAPRALSFKGKVRVREHTFDVAADGVGLTL